MAGGTGGYGSPGAGGAGGTYTDKTGSAGARYGGGGGGAAGGAGGAGGGGFGGVGGAGGSAGTAASPNGGAGGYSATYGGGGGGGGYSGVRESSFSTTNVTGGNGGGGGGGGGGTFFGGGGGTGGGGGGGGGGYGAIVSGASPGTNTATITGGNGGAGGGGTFFGGGGGGGGGGDGALLTNKGVTLTNGGRIKGGAGGTGGYGGYKGGAGGAGGAGLAASYGGTITNTSTITGGAGGIGGNANSNGGTGGAGGDGILGANLTIINSGTITAGSGGAGGAGGTNGAAGAAGDAIEFTGGSNTLTLGSGSTITGAIRLDTSTTTLTLAQSASATLANVIQGTGSVIKTGTGTLALTGTNSYAGNTTISAGTLAISASANLGSTSNTLVLNGGTLETTASLSTARNVTLTATGTVQVATGTTTLSGVVSGTHGLIKTGSGTLTLSGANTFSGVGTLLSAGTLDLAVANTVSAGTPSAPPGTVTAGALGTGGLTFDGSTQTPATLALETAAQPASGGTFGTTLANFGTGDELDLKGFTYAAADTVTYAGGTLTVTDATATEKFTLATPTSTAFTLVSDGSGGTDVMVCYASGTRIRTARGDVAVEHLRVGDLAVTSTGAHRPIRWLGHRAVDCRQHPRPHETMPVRIAAHAFGPNKPARDLLVSPGHALCIDLLGEVLIPAIALVNGTTITQEEVDAVTYWHVELDGHDILLAENMAAESYLDMGNRGFFAEAGVVALDASPDEGPLDASARTHADFCRPFHEDGPLVAAVRARLRARALSLGWSLDASDPFAGLHLIVDGARVEPAARGLAVRFAVPAGARAVWLVSATSRPCEVTGSPDGRDLGVNIAGLVIDDGFAPPRAVDLADPLLCVGFHSLEDGARRWTAGRARLPAALWAGHEGASDGFFLRVDLAGAALPRWVAPAADEAAVDEPVAAPTRRLVAGA